MSSECDRTSPLNQEDNMYGSEHETLINVRFTFDSPITGGIRQRESFKQIQSISRSPFVCAAYTRL